MIRMDGSENKSSEPGWVTPHHVRRSCSPPPRPAPAVSRHAHLSTRGGVPRHHNKSPSSRVRLVQPKLGGGGGGDTPLGLIGWKI